MGQSIGWMRTYRMFIKILDFLLKSWQAPTDDYQFLGRLFLSDNLMSLTLDMTLMIV